MYVNMLCPHNALRINQRSSSVGVASCVSEFSPKCYILATRMDTIVCFENDFAVEKKIAEF